jgi:hypothetical protein
VTVTLPPRRQAMRNEHITTPSLSGSRIAADRPAEPAEVLIYPLGRSTPKMYEVIMTQSHAVAPDVREDVAEESREHPPTCDATSRCLDSLAERLQSLDSGNSPEKMLQLGELVYRTLKDSSSSEGEGDHRASLRRIAAHPGIPFKITTIWRAVSVYEMSLRMPHLLDAKGLGISHLRAVIGLEPTDQELLLSRASHESWTKRQLEREAARFREGRRRRGRRPTPRITLWARELRRVLERSSELEELVPQADPSTKAELAVVLAELEEKSRQLRSRLAAEVVSP